MPKTTRSSNARLCVPVALLLALAAAPAAADSFALGARAGTMGLGAEGVWRATDRFSLRAGYHAFNYSTTFEESDVDYDGELRLRNAAVFVDWHPFAGRFRLSAGGVHSGNELTGNAAGELEVGDNTYEGTLDARIDWRDVTPYLGLGFGSPFAGGRWSLNAELGVMFVGKPDVALDGSVSNPLFEPMFRQDLERERENLREDLSDFRYYPVATVGLSYRF